MLNKKVPAAGFEPMTFKQLACIGDSTGGGLEGAQVPLLKKNLGEKL